MSFLVAIVSTSIVLCAAVLLCFGDSDRGIPNIDILIYSIVARMWQEGLLPYRDIVDHKPPMVYLFIRACFSLGGLGGEGIWRGFHILSALAGISLFLGFRSLGLYPAGLVCCAAYLFFFWGDPLEFKVTSFLNAEQISSLWLAFSFGFILIYTAKLRSIWAFLSGGAFALAVASKQPAAPFIIPVIGQILYANLIRHHHTFKRALFGPLVFVLGCITPLFFIALYFWWHNAFNNLWYWIYTANLNYADVRLQSLSARLKVLGEHIRLLQPHLLHSWAIPYCSGLILTVVLFFIRRAWIDLIAILWLLAGILSLALNVHFADHYFIFFQVPLAISCSALAHVFLLDSFWIKHSSKFGRALACGVTIGFLIYYSSRITDQLKRGARFFGESAEKPVLQRQFEEIAVKLKDLVGPNDRVLFYGPEPQIILYTGFKPAARYFYTLNAKLVVGEEGGFRRDFMADVLAAKPPIAFISQFYPAIYDSSKDSLHGDIARYLDSNYVPLIDNYGGRFFVRKDLQPSVPVLN
jgi:hypothetical protein